MKKIIFLFSFLSIVFAIYAQVKIDTVYIKGEKETVKDSAVYFRVRTISAGTLRADDYFMKDSVHQCSGTYSSFSPYIKEGDFMYYTDNGEVSSGGKYLADKRSGVWKTYYPNGTLWTKVEYVLGEKEGELIGYYKTGEVKRKEQYKNGEFTKVKCYTKTGADTTYYEFYIMPVFKGGDAELIKYFQKNLKYPAEALKYKLEGKVYVMFTVKKDGSVNDVKIVPGRSSYYLFNDAAVEFVKNMPKWTPGYIDGELKDFTKVIPVKFQLNK